MEEEYKGLPLNNRKMSKKINYAFLLVYAIAIFIYLGLKILTHLECTQLSQYNEKPVKVEDLVCESFPVSSDSETFSHTRLFLLPSTP